MFEVGQEYKTELLEIDQQWLINSTLNIQPLFIHFMLAV